MCEGWQLLKGGGKDLYDQRRAFRFCGADESRELFNIVAEIR